MIKQLLTLLAIPSLTLSCITPGQNSNSRFEKPSSQLSGGALGAVAGAVLGNQVKGGKHTRRNARLAGALIGGLVGNRVGNYMDQQEQQLKQELQSTGVRVSRDGEQITLNMPGSITFSSGRSSIQRDFYPVLNSVSKVLSKYKQTQVEVRGHTDNQGSARNNQVLSEQRAMSVASYLKKKGVAKRRLDILGLGESDPVSSNHSPSGRSENRRVEIKLIPISH